MDPHSDDFMKRLWKWALHEDALFHHRAEFFVLSETIFLVGFVTLVDKQDPATSPLQIMLSFSGFVLSTLWASVAAHQRDTIDQIKDRFKRNATCASAGEFEKFYLMVKSERKRKSSANEIMGEVMPLLFMILWGAIIAWTLWRYCVLLWLLSLMQG